MTLAKDKRTLLQEGAFIPAHPLALTAEKRLDEASQRQLTRYYLEAGVDGMAVGVHTTQFEIRDPEFDLYEPVLRLAQEEVKKAKCERPILMIAGVCGQTEQAIAEAKLAKNLGYDMVLLSNGGLDSYSETELLERTRTVAAILPVFGFYLQTAVGGRALSYNFWRAFSDIAGVEAIKLAPFNRYQTLEVVRAVCHSKRADEIALYTGNDDNIVVDLFTEYEINVGDRTIRKPIVGGLLGHWSVWTKKAVELFREIKEARSYGMISKEWLTTAQKVTDANGAFFDTENQFKGSIAGINEVLRRQGLLEGNWCLMSHEVLSGGQYEEISRVENEYTELNDKLFVESFLSKKAPV